MRTLLYVMCDYETRLPEFAESPIIKIGITSNLKKRTQNHKSANPLNLKTVRLFAFEDRNTAISVETELIRHLKSKFHNVNNKKELFFHPHLTLSVS